MRKMEQRMDSSASYDSWKAMLVLQGMHPLKGGYRTICQLQALKTALFLPQRGQDWCHQHDGDTTKILPNFYRFHGGKVMIGGDVCCGTIAKDGEGFCCRIGHVVVFV